MPRQRRTWEPGAGAHAISRFVDRRFYLLSDEDRAAYLDAIERADERWDWVYLSFALMSSHVHSGHVAGLVDPEHFFRSAHTRFAQGYHARSNAETLGPVFAGRPSIYVVGEANLSRMVAYHHRNVVEAGVVERARDSPWTSHRAYLRLDPAPSWLDVERGLSILGFSDTEAGRRRFDEFVMEVDLSGWEPCETSGEYATTTDHTLGDAEWERLISEASAVAGLARGASLRSKAPRAVMTRRLVSTVATRDLGQPYRCVAEHLGMRTGSVCNLVSRTCRDARFPGLLDELRRRLACGPRGE